MTSLREPQDEENIVARKAVLKKTEALRALRLAKEAEDRAAEALKPKKKTKAKKRTKLPTFERDV